MDTKRLTTLALITRNDNLLLIRRRKNPNRGLLVPPGGKIRLKESPHHCVEREVAEETGLVALESRLRGVITQVAPVQGQQWMLFVYRIERWGGRVRRSHREGDPTWIPIEAIRTGQADIPDADRIFLPRLLRRGAGVVEMKFHHRRDLSVARWE